jgi:hypothetical protein
VVYILIINTHLLYRISRCWFWGYYECRVGNRNGTQPPPVIKAVL